MCDQGHAMPPLGSGDARAPQHAYVAVVRPAEANATLAPFYSSCLQPGRHGARSRAALRTQARPTLRPAPTSWDVHALLVMLVKYHHFRSVLAVRQLCQCAKDSCRDWLELMEGAELSLIAHKVDQSVTLLLLLLFWLLIAKTVIVWQDSVLRVGSELVLRNNWACFTLCMVLRNKLCAAYWREKRNIITRSQYYNCKVKFDVCISC